MKTQKHHLVNWQLGKTICGLNIKSESIRLASNEEGKWFNDYGNQLDTNDYESVFCINCLKLHESNLIEQFKTETFLVQYELQLPKSKRLRKAKKVKSKRNRIAGIKTVKANPITKPVKSKPVKSKPVNSIPKSAKGIARDERKAQVKSNPIEKPTVKSNPIPTDDKCKIISKPDIIKEDDPIELTPEMEVKPLIDLSNGPVIIETEVIEDIDPIDDWEIGDPIDKDIFELMIGDNWKLVRHNKQLDKWQFQLKSVVKGIPEWIADSEFITYKEASEFISEGYCG